MLSKTDQNITLTRYIKWQIGNRIMLCFALLTICILLTSGYDIFNGFNHVKIKVNTKCSNLSEFIIAQSLIENYAGIDVKFVELNSADTTEHFVWLPKNTSPNLAQQKPDITWQFPLSWIYVFPVIDNDNKTYGEIRVTGSFLYDRITVIHLVTKFVLSLFFAVMIFAVLYPLSSRIPRELFIAPIMNLLDLLKKREHNPNNYQTTLLAIELREVQTKIIELINEIREQTHEVALGQIATLVAHDIRSPLAALNMAMKNVTSIPEDERALIRSATNRIHDIAHNLLGHYQKPHTLEIKGPMLGAELISELISSVIAEKRIQHPHQSIIYSVNDTSAYHAFARLSASSFKRSLSNLLDNALEATQKKISAPITVKLCATPDKLELSIQDSGCGIPDHILKRILAGRNVSAKTGGHGLGLSTAIKIFKIDFGGQLVIHTKVNVGTHITITLPTTQTPSWFASKLYVIPAATVVILDDDETIHQVWRARFNKLSAHINLIEFYHAEALKTWCQKNFTDAVIFLIDYELIGSTMSGIDVINKCQISSRSFLVTSLYHESSIRKKCAALNMQLIPKSYATYIPIMLLPTYAVHPDLIFVDDDKDLTKAWDLHGRRKGKNIVTFNRIEDLRAALIYFNSKDIPIYIDAIFGRDEVGLEFAKELYHRGFRKLYLATGKPRLLASDTPWITDIVGKTPPF